MGNPEDTKPENETPTLNQDNRKMNRNSRMSQSDLEQILPCGTPERDGTDHRTDITTEQRPNGPTMETIYELIAGEITEPEQEESHDSNNTNST